MSKLFCPQASRFPAFFSCPPSLTFGRSIKVLCGNEQNFDSITIQEHCLLSFLFSFAVSESKLLNRFIPNLLNIRPKMQISVLLCPLSLAVQLNVGFFFKTVA